MRYSYKSNGIVSRSIGDYRDSVISDFASFQIWEGAQEFTEGQYQTITIAQTSVAANNYGNIAAYGSEGIGSRTKGSGVGVDTQVASGGILIVGERGPVHLSGEAVTYPKYVPYTNINCFGSGANRYCIYSYESGNVSETVGQHGPSTINFLGARRIDSFQFVFDVWQPISRFVGAAECKVYNYEPCITEDYNELDYGLITANHTSTADYGSVAEVHYAGEFNYGHILDGYKTRFGFSKVIGKAEAAATNAWVGSGRIVSFSRQVSPSVYGWITDGKVRSFTVHGTADVDYSPAMDGRGILLLRGTSTESFCLEYSGSGLFKKFSGAAESITWNPDEKQMLFSFIGVGSEKQTDNYIGTGLLHTFSGAVESRTSSDDIAAGLFRVGGSGHSSETDTYIGSGVFSTFSGLSESTTWNPDEKQMLFSFTGECIIKSTYGYSGSGNLFNLSGASESITNVPVGGGLWRFSGDSHETRSRIFVGSGIFSTFSGLSESTTWNPDEKQMLFSFTGGSVEKHVGSYFGSGRIRNLAKVEAEKGTFNYIGSGELKLRPRKPTTYKLSELANFTLEIETPRTQEHENFGDNAYGWNGTTQLGGVLVCDLHEKGHEKFAKVYDDSAVVEFVRKDYGTLLNQQSLYIDYGNVADDHAAAPDYGWILDTSDLRTPYGRGLRFTSQVEVNVTQTFEWTSTGEGYGKPVFRFAGITKLPLDVSEYGSGNLFAMGGAAEAVSNVEVGEGLWRFTGDSHETRRRVFVGSGRIPVFKGAAESTTWNPEEKQMLFSILGSGIEKHTEIYIGSGNLFTFSGASESAAYVPPLQGLFGIQGDSHDTRSRVFVGSGSFKKFSGAVESATWNPEEQQMLFDIRGVAQDSNTDCHSGSGYFSHFSSGTESILWAAQHTTGLYRISGDSYDTRARSFAGSGSLKKFNGAAESATWNPDEKQMLFSFTGGATDKNTEVYVGSGYFSHFSSGTESILWAAQHTQGLFRVDGDSHDTRSRVHVGSGSLKKFNGAAESATWNPEEKQMLFSFLGGITSEKHTEVYVGSGRIRNFASLDERQTFDYVGFGTIKLLPRKPYCYPLSDLATFTLDNYVIPSRYIDLGDIHFYDEAVTQLGPVQLTHLVCEEGHEKHTEVYNNSACEDGAELDYGSLINTTSLVCTDVSGNITTNTTAATGCIRVAPGTVLTLNTGVTYTVPIITTTPTAFEDYGLVSDPNTPQQRDYGHILDTLSKVCPFGLGKVTGTAKTHFVENIISTGYSVTGKAGLSLFGAAATFWTPPFIGDGLFRISSFFQESFTPATEIGDGILFSMGGGAESVANVGRADGLFRFGGDSHDTRARVFVGSGSLKKFSGLSESTTWNPEERQMLFSILGSGIEKHTEVYVGSGNIRKLGGAAESVANVGRADGLFRIGGDGYCLFSLLHPASGLIRITGEGEEPRARVYIGSGSLKKFSGAAESATWNPDEKQMLFSFTGSGTERVTLNPPEEGAEIRLRGEAVLRATISQVGDLRIPIFGDATSKTTKPFIGSGSLKKFSGAAESATWNPEEKQMLFSFTGEHEVRFTANPPEEGTEIRISGTAAPYFFVPNYPGYGVVRVTGEGDTTRARDFVGSGSLRKFSGAAESITFNPEERQLLFSFTGTGSERTFVIPPEGDGVLFTFGGSTAISAAAYESTGLFRVGGTSGVRWVPNNVGSGTLKKFSGAAESITVNPDEKQMLFSFTGAGSERTFVVPPEGDGRISIYPEASDYRFTPNWNSDGGVRIEIQSTYRFAPVWIGSGTLKKFSGAAESITFNPEEKQLLFSFVGERIAEKRTSREVSKGGTIRLDGTPKVIWIPNNIGSGTIKLSGDAKTHWTPHVIGSGGLWSWAGAAESLSVSPAGLFTFLRIQGDSPTSRSVVYTGSGSLKKFQGAAESITWNPDEKQMLFSFLGEGTSTRARSESGQGRIKISGDAGARFVPAIIGSGTTRLSGDVHTTTAKDFVGSGSLKKISGAAESITWNPEEKQMLFSFLGTGAESKTSKLLSQSGVLTVRGTSGDPLLTFAEQPRVEIDITGDSVDLRSHAYAGSGRISNVNNADEAFTRDTYDGSGRIGPLSGFALVQIVVWQPAHTQVWII